MVFSLRFIDLMGLTVLYVLLRFLYMKNQIWLTLSIILSGVVQAAYGIFQLLGYFPSLHASFNISGSYFNPGPYAGFLASVWPFALGVYLFRKELGIVFTQNTNRFNKLNQKTIRFLYEYIPLLGIVAIGIVLPATRSRSAWLAVLVSSFFILGLKYGLLKWTKKLPKIKKVLLSTITFALVSACFYGLYHFKKGSADGRALIWKVSSKMIKESPVFGKGLDRFKTYCMDAQADYFLDNPSSNYGLVADNSNYAFNEPLQLVAENGLIALTLLIVSAFLIFKIKTVTHENLALKIIAIATLISILVFGMFSYPMQILPIKMVGVLCLAMLAQMDIKKSYFKNTLNGKWPLIKVPFVLIYVAVVTVVYLRLSQIQKGFKSWKMAMDNYNYGHYQKSVREFEKSLPILKK